MPLFDPKKRSPLTLPTIVAVLPSFRLATVHDYLWHHLIRVAESPHCAHYQRGRNDIQSKIHMPGRQRYA